ncbi:MAG: protocatechuate 3,4-dioxygenase, beta subunit [Gammaproteobacteria bacterium]|nr:protocatechuate 3,4-dioxygenase, beta subunit [Gammaproteobacteria bacterium]
MTKLAERGAPATLNAYADEDGASPPSLFPDYRSTALRSPLQARLHIPQTLTEVTGPAGCWERLMGAAAADLTCQHAGTPLGQRIIVEGRVLDEARRPVSRTVIEIWQANAAGRYIHSRDNWDAPLDPNFTGAGRVVTDDEGRYRYVTVRPGAYPWGNHRNAWRPAHIHLSLLGPAFATRLVTQMYFPDDPLIDIDPIANAVPMPYRQRMVGRFDIAVCEPNWALGYRFDIVLKGAQATPFESE